MARLSTRIFALGLLEGVWFIGLAHVKIQVWYQDTLPPLCNIIISFAYISVFCLFAVSGCLYLSFVVFSLRRLYRISQGGLQLCAITISIIMLLVSFFVYFHVQFSVMHLAPLVMVGRNRNLSMEIMLF